MQNRWKPTISPHLEAGWRYPCAALTLVNAPTLSPVLRTTSPLFPPPVNLPHPLGRGIQAFLDGQRTQPFPYCGVGNSRHVPPAGYVVDHRRVCLGTGQCTFEAACAALRCWQMFQVRWVQLCWPTTGMEPGAVVGILASWGGLWFLNACRIVYVLDESSPGRVGFAYGTRRGMRNAGGSPASNGTAMIPCGMTCWRSHDQATG